MANDDWNMWREHVLAELKRFNETSAEMNDKITRMAVCIGKLQVQAGAWGALGGGVIAAAAILISMAAR